MVPCILVDREGLGNELLFNGCVGTAVVTVMAKKLVVSPKVQTRDASHHVLVPEREPGWLDIIASKFTHSLFYTQSSVDRLEPTTMVCTSFLFVLDHCNVGRIDRGSGSRSMDHGRISREGWQ